MTVRRLTPLMLAAALLVAPAARADDAAPPRQKDPLADTEEAIVRALTRTMDLLSRTFDQVMPYETPELLPNGDILIRRKRPPQDKPAPPAAGDAERVPL